MNYYIICASPEERQKSISLLESLGLTRPLGDIGDMEFMNAPDIFIDEEDGTFHTSTFYSGAEEKTITYNDYKNLLSK